MTVLLPRLSTGAAEAMLDGMLREDRLIWSGFNPDDLPQHARFAATGGNRISRDVLLAFSNELHALARDHGFGDDKRKSDFARFDAAASAFLSLQQFLASGEGLRDDVWTFMAVVIAPDIVHWRFSSARERYLGGVRNTFQRLFMRGSVLDLGDGREDRWSLLDELTEDALVQITERPSIGSDAYLATALAEAWVRASKRYGRGAMERIMRLATLRLRIRNEIRSLTALKPTELARTIDEFFERAAETLELHEVTATGREGSQATSSSSTGDSAEVSSTEERMPKRSWAIWRAR
jgi:hypothetical protein